MNGSAGGTKQHILEAAERLFAAQGVAATSLRAIIRDADVNLAAVHYHFGSKDALVNAVIARHFRPLNEERLRELDEAERRAGKRGPSVERIVEAFIGPTLRLGADSSRGDNFMRLIGRLLVEPEYFFERVAPVQLGDVRNRFLGALHRALPKLPPEEMIWRMMFTVGCMAYSMRIGGYIGFVSEGLARPATPEELTARLVRFVTAGLRAAPAEEAQ